jgi:hypothetical protein
MIQVADELLPGAWLQATPTSLAVDDESID